MSAMTLEQVRDWLLARTKYVHLPITNAVHQEMADAIDAHLAQPAQSVDIGAVSSMADLLRAVSPEGERWTSSNPNNPTVLDIRYLADKLTAALQEKGNV